MQHGTIMRHLSENGNVNVVKRVSIFFASSSALLSLTSYMKSRKAWNTCIQKMSYMATCVGWDNPRLLRKDGKFMPLLGEYTNWRSMASVFSRFRPYHCVRSDCFNMYFTHPWLNAVDGTRIIWSRVFWLCPCKAYTGEWCLFFCLCLSRGQWKHYNMYYLLKGYIARRYSLDAHHFTTFLRIQLWFCRSWKTRDPSVLQKMHKDRYPTTFGSLSVSVGRISLLNDY